MQWRERGLEGPGARRAGENAAAGAPIARVRIRGGQIACTACGHLSAAVVLLDADRPLCSDCVGERPPTPERPAKLGQQFWRGAAPRGRMPAGHHAVAGREAGAAGPRAC